LPLVCAGYDGAKRGHSIASSRTSRSPKPSSTARLRFEIYRRFAPTHAFYNGKVQIGVRKNRTLTRRTSSVPLSRARSGSRVRDWHRSAVPKIRGCVVPFRRGSGGSYPILCAHRRIVTDLSARGANRCRGRSYHNRSQSLCPQVSHSLSGSFLFGTRRSVVGARRTRVGRPSPVKELLLWGRLNHDVDVYVFAGRGYSGYLTLIDSRNARLIAGAGRG